MSDQSFTPALGRLGSLGIYDRAIRLLTREQLWRAALLRQVEPQAGELILDIGCGTGKVAIMLKRLCPAARVVALDPDPDVLKIAARKGIEAGVSIEWCEGFASDAEGVGRDGGQGRLEPRLPSGANGREACGRYRHVRRCQARRRGAHP